MSIENTLERIAVALEQIAQARMMLLNGCAATATEENVSQEPEGPGSDPAKELTRDEIKKALREKGIAFKESAKTESLKALLAKSEHQVFNSKNELKNPPETCPCPLENRETGYTDKEVVEWCNLCGTVHSAKLLPVETKAGDVEKTLYDDATLEQARDALVALATAKGKDKALDVLQKAGKAERLNAVAPSLYGAVVQACKEAQNG